MARPKTGFYSTIEYVGARPRKPKKPSFFGGWVILVITAGAGIFFVKPWLGNVLAAQVGPTVEQTEELIGGLLVSGNKGDDLGAEALRYAGRETQYDPSYFKIKYPNGDVPFGKGVAADVVVRCYRQVGVDLQELIHEDMEKNLRAYPQLWDAQATDSNIDHRRVPNIQRFLSRHGESKKISRDFVDYAVGDVVVWALADAEAHIGIVVPDPAGEPGVFWVVHHPSGGKVQWENALFDHQVIGHYRYPSR